MHADLLGWQAQTLANRVTPVREKKLVDALLSHVTAAVGLVHAVDLKAGARRSRSQGAGMGSSQRTHLPLLHIGRVHFPLGWVGDGCEPTAGRMLLHLACMDHLVGCTY